LDDFEDFDDLQIIVDGFVYNDDEELVVVAFLQIIGVRDSVLTDGRTTMPPYDDFDRDLVIGSGEMVTLSDSENADIAPPDPVAVGGRDAPDLEVRLNAYV
jgi:hypothetical protein